ncbi:hypothetical protein TcCL_NonESM11100 [Trypanosoma cruzi]|nr:hypothetical protein TcCL_NonESM11100 [Trypanosoma cruzi]
MSEKRYAPLGSLINPLNILSQSSPCAMHKEHHGKNAQELICKTLNSFRVNEECGIIHAFHNNVDLLFPERPPIHIARDHNKEKVTPPVKPSFRGGGQGTIQQNTANRHICHKGHRRLMRQMHSTEEESCSQHTQRTDTERVGGNSTRATSFNHRQRSPWALQPKPFSVDASDNSTKQREAPVGHHIWATDTTHPPIHSSSSQWRGPPSPPQTRLLLSHASLRRKHSSGVSAIQNSAPPNGSGNARRGHTAPQRSLNPPHDSSMRRRGIQAALVSQKTANGSAVHMQKMPRSETEERGGSQRVSPATPDVRRLIFATEK